MSMLLPYSLTHLLTGSYGNYDLTFDPSSKELIGHKVPTHSLTHSLTYSLTHSLTYLLHNLFVFKRDNPSSWRRATYLRPLGPEALSSVPSHDHSHNHVHHEGCGSSCGH